MILKMNNKNKNFYTYMGKIFGSRIIEKQTNDRIYDDNDKEWYIYLKESKTVAFVSISKGIIKNIYSTKQEYLEEILKEIRNDIKICPSVVSRTYIEIYEKIGFKIINNSNYKNFIEITA